MEKVAYKKTARIWEAFFSLWLLVLLSTPPVISLFGAAAVSIVVTTGVVLLLVAICSSVLKVWPVSRLLKASAMVLLVTLALEVIGVNFGLLFGNYHYTNLFSFHVLGVPLLIPFVWLMMLFPAWGISGLILNDSSDTKPFAYRVKFAALSGLVLLCWDFYVDPQMVSFGAWVWESPSGYFGTPWLNFVGWWLTGFTATFLARPGKLPETQMLMIYTAIWLLQFVALSAIWGHPLAALCGFAAMGSFVLWGWNSWRERYCPVAWKSFLQKS